MATRWPDWETIHVSPECPLLSTEPKTWPSWFVLVCGVWCGMKAAWPGKTINSRGQKQENWFKPNIHRNTWNGYSMLRQRPVLERIFVLICRSACVPRQNSFQKRKAPSSHNKNKMCGGAGITRTEQTELNEGNTHNNQVGIPVCWIVNMVVNTTNTRKCLLLMFLFYLIAQLHLELSTAISELKWIKYILRYFYYIT